MNVIGLKNRSILNKFIKDPRHLIISKIFLETIFILKEKKLFYKFNRTNKSEFFL